MKRIILSLAEGDSVAPLVIEAKTCTLPKFTESDCVARYGRFYQSQAVPLVDALIHSLPGGTIDAVIAELFRRRSTIFAVPFDMKGESP